MSTRPARPRRVATVASPLQAMSLQEAVTAGHVEPPEVILVHGREAIDPTLQLTDPELRAAAVEVASGSSELRMLWRAHEIVVGDPFSRLVNLAVLSRRSGRIVLLEDGAAALRAWRALATRTPFVRAHERRGSARMLGAMAAARLRRLARRADVLLVGGLPMAAEVAVSLDRRSIVTAHHDFAWARKVALPEDETRSAIASAERVVLGTALCADGYVRADAYERWLRDRLEGERVVFVPHRRDDVRTVDLAAELGAHVPRPDHLCVELLLRDAGAGVTVDAFPMTAALTVPLVRAERSTDLRVTRLAPNDWTAKAPAGMIALVDEIAGLAEASSERSEDDPMR